MLERIVLDSNKLTGRIPTTLFNISTVQAISLSDNHFSGNFPSSFGQTLPNLEYIFLGMNNFSGAILDSISNASKLIHLDVAFNRFTGSIPSSLGNLGLLQFLHLGGNNFTSEPSLPELSFLTSLTNCRQLRVLWIHENPLNVFLPVSIGNLSDSLETISASGCGIKGNIPSEIGNLRNLASVYLSGNYLTGVIPTTIKGLSKLQRLHLEDNRIDGSIPKEICHLLNLGDLGLSENRLFGTIPECLGNVTSLRYLYLDSNRLNSSIPENIWNLKNLLQFNLSSNSFSGYLPQAIGNLKVATVLDLSVNQIHRLEGSVSTRSGVYSYGIVLMAIFTRRKPTDDLFAGDLSLKDWVNQSLPDAIIHVVDSNLLRLEEENYTAKMQCLSSIMELGLKCSAESPHERINMKDALIVLKKIKLQLIKNCK
ncbi:probable LRR receptor-like serine/threonine-protein kinase At3g47570 [Cornus florida]|uniref:probable LRR receptor-like serine/threonine-protein kinase At3g47570 n=1 Tax=Cornus florida TaxID=4283 RepID=UPI00289671D7|nr:probable LRR receptor-like serine/threonine-protein kinase At3g47570 [Cornus florida]